MVKARDILTHRQRKSFKKFDNYYLMTKQLPQEYINGQRSTTELSYSNIKLLSRWT
ncbi:DUF3386 family protein [Dendronalium phyllosphericum]|uniref:DUF3386 family protein n=1 Tax=Dendronalium phyllosphericum TaxID=2840445 RepID=UPI001CEDC47B|nr:DUF3386 family protein [Dendronalium phyllosphericum]